MIESTLEALKDYIVTAYPGFTAAYPAAPALCLPGLDDIGSGSPDATNIGSSHIKVFFEFEDFINLAITDINGDFDLELPLTIYVLINPLESSADLDLLLIRQAEAFIKLFGDDPTLGDQIEDSELSRLKLYKSVEGDNNIKGIEFKLTLKSEVNF